MALNLVTVLCNITSHTFSLAVSESWGTNNPESPKITSPNCPFSTKVFDAAKQISGTTVLGKAIIDTSGAILLWQWLCNWEPRPDMTIGGDTTKSKARQNNLQLFIVRRKGGIYIEEMKKLSKSLVNSLTPLCKKNAQKHYETNGIRRLWVSKE